MNIINENMKITSSVFQNGEPIPKKYGYNFENINPPLQIIDIPENTKSLVLIMDDPDAMEAVGKIWTHWLIANISPNVTIIPENTIPSNSIEGKNDFNETGYGGPAPPDKEHTYNFTIYALNSILDIKKNFSKSEVLELMKKHIILQVTLKGIFFP